MSNLKKMSSGSIHVSVAKLVIRDVRFFMTKF